MLTLKAFHIMAMVTWFAGLFYLPRLFVYHADTHDAPGIDRFKIMERRLYVITQIGMLLTLALGIALMVGYGMAWFKASHWLHAKLTLVVLLIGYTHVCGAHVKRFARDANSKSAKYFRLFNEVPALFLVGIIYLAVARPF